MNSLIKQLKLKENAKKFERDEINRIRRSHSSSFIEVYKVTCGDEISYISSSSPEQAKVDYLMVKKYQSMPKNFRKSVGAICNPKPCTDGISAKLVS